MGSPHAASGSSPPPVPNLRAAVQEELDAILESPGFRNSEQSKRLLGYLVEHSLAGEWERLKERAIGVALFGREPGYDSNEDPIVRVRANEIRKRLARFYQDCAAPPRVRFDVPPGGYRVEFAVPLEAPAPAATAAASVERRPWKRPRLWWPAAGVLCAALAAWFLLARGLSHDPLDDFWRPALANASPVILCTGHPVVYRFTFDFFRREQGAGTDHGHAQTDPVLLRPGQQIQASDIVTVPNQYVGLGTAHALARLSAWFASRHKDSEIRVGNDLSFADLRKSPAVLIGAFQNRWTIEFSRGLRFVFVTVEGVPGIRDTQTGKQWLLPQLKDDGSTDEDYLVISRIFNSNTGQFMVAVAPVTQYGAQAAGEILTRPATLAEGLKQASPGWQHRNLQLLYHVQIIGQAPGPPKLLALHEW